MTVLGAAQGATYPLDALPTVRCDTADAASGVAAGAVLTITRDNGGGYTATCTDARDIAGNETAPVVVTFTAVATTDSLTSLTGDYVLGSHAPNADGVHEQLSNKLRNGLVCQYISAVARQVTAPNPTLTQAAADELIYWARTMDPGC